MNLLAILILAASTVIAVDVRSPNHYFGNPVISGTVATFPATYYYGPHLQGNCGPNQAACNISTTLQTIVSPAGTWDVEIAGGDFGPNKNVLTLNGLDYAQFTETGKWRHHAYATVNGSGVLDIGVYIELLLHFSEPQPNSYAVYGLTLTYNPLPGDANHSGAVDAGDYVTLRSYQATPAEYGYWRANFGAIASQSISEPRSLFLFLFVPAAVMVLKK